MVTSPRVTWQVLEVMKDTDIFSERDARELAHQDSTIYLFFYRFFFS